MVNAFKDHAAMDVASAHGGKLDSLGDVVAEEVVVLTLDEIALFDCQFGKGVGQVLVDDASAIAQHLGNEDIQCIGKQVM